MRPPKAARKRFHDGLARRQDAQAVAFTPKSGVRHLGWRGPVEGERASERISSIADGGAKCP
jgi:hypothetical protein